MPKITIPSGQFCVPTTDDQSLKQRLAKLREALVRGGTVTVDQQGTIQAPSSSNDPNQQGRLVIPPGKLAASFYWYENDPELFTGEQMAMTRNFPSFSLQKENDGRLSWMGTVRPAILPEQPTYTLLAVYGHNHPSNDTFGGSVKVYVVDPDLEALTPDLGIPHTLRDSAGQLYLCTARREDIRVGQVVTSAASSIGMAVKWLAAFEMWLKGEISTELFAGHNI